MEEENSFSFENKKEEKFAKIESAIARAKGKVKSELNDKYTFLALSAICAILISFHYTKIIGMPTWLLVVVWIASVFFLLAFLGSDVIEAKSELEANEAMRNVMQKLPDSTNSTTQYFESLVKINVENLSAYYSLVKTHTQQSFKVSLMTGVLGFILISVGLVLGFQFKEYERIGYIASGSGIFVEFISGVLFYLYNKTVRQLKEYHDSLINVQNILLSFKLIESIKDEKSKTEMIGKMITRLVGIEKKFIPNQVGD